MKIAEREVGAGHPVYIIAEAGSNHSNRWEYALELVDVAVEAGADAVKFQLRQMPTWDWLPQLAEYAKSQGIHCLCTPSPDKEGIDFVVKYCPAIKWPGKWSQEHELLTFAMMSTLLPVIMSVYPQDECKLGFRCVDWGYVALLHCVGEYPTPPEHVNIDAMTVLEDGRPVYVVGYSDHTVHPTIAPVAAVALGAKIIEKHFTLFHADIDSPDHSFSVTPYGLKQVVEAIRMVEVML